MKNLTVSLLVFAAVAACGPSDAPAPAAGADDPDYAGTWTFESGRDAAGDLPLVDGYPITLDLEGDEARGVAACNSYGGGVSIEGSAFEAGGFAVSEVGCDPQVVQSEKRYLDALAAADAIAVDGSTLTLTGPDVELVFRRAPPVKTKSLVDRRWKLDTLLEGHGPDELASSADPASLRLSSDGTFAGSTGCRDFSGEWIELGDTISLTSMSFDGTCGAGGADQDQHVIAVLGAGFRATVEGGELTLTAARGSLGLVYRAGR